MDSSENKLSDRVTDEAEAKSSIESEPKVDGSGAANGNPQPPVLMPSAPLLKRASTAPLSAPLSAPLLSPSLPPSVIDSPKPSREPSPIRLPPKPASAAPSRGSRSRQNSQELSPNRGPASTIPTVPSAAAIQRALSAAGAPQLQLPSPANSDLSSDLTRAFRPSKSSSSGSGPPTLNVARVKSPPPSTATHKASIYSSRKVERAASTPAIVLERSSPSTTRRVEGIDEGQEDNLVPTGMRTPHRGMGGTGATLETVRESSLPTTPAISGGRPSPVGFLASGDRSENTTENSADDASAKGTGTKAESGSESGGTVSAGARNESQEPRKTVLASNAAKPPTVHPKKSFTQILPTKGRTGSEGMIKNMTVETETVSTIPQVSLGGGAGGERTGLGRAETAGSLRLKPSTETIRPRKEKKRVARKAPAVNSGTGGSISRRFHHHHLQTRPPSPASTLSLSTTSSQFSPRYVTSHYSSQAALQSVARKPKQSPRRKGADGRPDSEGVCGPSNAALTSVRGRTASSKADIFEAKIASAVDEVNSSDSGETFVYESNPPEALSARPYRYHSRTPSATSMVSQMDQYGPKSRQDGHHTIAGKKSMKFVNNPYHAAGYLGKPTDGAVRGISHSGRASVGNASHSHSFGRFGRGGASHTSLFDADSPFPPASRPLRAAAAHVARLSPRTTNPRSPALLRVSGSAKRAGESMSYDLEGEGADDERTPLVSSVRSGRSRYSRRGVASSSWQSSSADEGRNPFCRRATALVSLGSAFTLLICGIVGILSMCSKTLYDVQVRDIRNVLASEQEIMLDLHVKAVNPNLIAVQVNDLDVNIFAKYKHVGTNALGRRHHNTVPDHAISTVEASEEYSASTYLHHSGQEPEYHVLDNVDEGTDPIDDPEVDSQTMLLGRIFQFDSPLIFDASPFRHHLLSATGGLRLAHPGNKSEEGGTRRWEKVMQYDFELIIRGVLRYSTPITSRPRSASISGSVFVHVGDGDDQGDLTALSVSPDTRGAGRNVPPPQARRHRGRSVNLMA